MGFFFVVEARVSKNVVIWVKGDYCCSSVFNGLQIGVTLSDKRKMISLFKKVVLLATNFFFHLWLRKRSILKTFPSRKRFFLMNIFLKEKFAPMSSQPTNVS